MTPVTVSASKGRLPARSSYNTVPAEKTSARPSAAAPDSCSGALYAALPTTPPPCV
jgi:hypothetical protein